MSKNNVKIPLRAKSTLVALIGAACMLLLLFLPYVSAEKDYAERLEKYEDDYIDEENDITYGQMIKVSLFELAKFSVIDESAWDWDESGSIYFWGTVVFAAFATLTLIFALARKQKTTFVFGLLSFAIISLLNLEINDVIVEGSRYRHGIAYYLVYVATLAVLVGAVWMMVDKRKAKKALKANTPVEE